MPHCSEWRIAAQRRTCLRREPWSCAPNGTSATHQVLTPVTPTSPRTQETEVDHLDRMAGPRKSAALCRARCVHGEHKKRNVKVRLKPDTKNVLRGWRKARVAARTSDLRCGRFIC